MESQAGFTCVTHPWSCSGSAALLRAELVVPSWGGEVTVVERKVKSWGSPLPLSRAGRRGARSLGRGCHAFSSCKMARLDCG